MEWLGTAPKEEVDAVVELGRAMLKYGKSRVSAQVPVAIGTQGEEHVRSVIADRYPTTSTAHTPKSGDLSVRVLGQRVMVEVKNYTGAIPRESIDKFVRDIDVSLPDAGVFISLGSRIAKKSNFSIEYVQGRPVVYMVGRDDEIIITAVEIAANLARHTTQSKIERHRVTQHIDALDQSVQLLGCIRDDMLTGIGKFAVFVSSMSPKITRAELEIRTAISAMRADVDGVNATCPLLLNRCSNFASYQQPYRDVIEHIVSYIEENWPSQRIPSWVENGNTIVHCATTISMRINIRAATLTIPRHRIATDDLLNAIDAHSATVGEDVVMPITTGTLDWIKRSVH